MMTEMFWEMFCENSLCPNHIKVEAGTHVIYKDISCISKMEIKRHCFSFIGENGYKKLNLCDTCFNAVKMHSKLNKS